MINSSDTMKGIVIQPMRMLVLQNQCKIIRALAFKFSVTALNPTYLSSDLTMN